MKGVIAMRAPGVSVVDLTHGIPPQAVAVGAFVLRASMPYFPLGTVHVAVVDPGVGSERRALCIETRAGCLVGPDNGVLAPAAQAAGVRRVIELTEERFFLTPRSATFHGRDVFAPVAAALASGTSPGALGTERNDFARLDLPSPSSAGDEVRGAVLHVDHFGNLITNIPPALFPATAFVVRVGDVRIGPVADTYGAVAIGAVVAVVDSFGLLEIAVRDGRASDALGVGVGIPVSLVPA